MPPIRPLPALAGALLALAGCAAPLPPLPTAPPPGAIMATAPDRVPPRAAVETFETVVARVEPVAEALCRQNPPPGGCDLLIVVNERPGLPANAFQTTDRRGRPVVGFTRALIADARNADEVAFVLGHEAAHHLAGHIGRARRSAAAGQAALGQLATPLRRRRGGGCAGPRSSAPSWAHGATGGSSSSRPTRWAP